VAYSNRPQRLRHVCSTDPTYSAPPDSLAGLGEGVEKRGEGKGREKKGEGGKGKQRGGQPLQGVF